VYFDKILSVKSLDLAAYFTTIDFEGWNPREIPATSGAQSQIERSMDNWKQWLNEVLCNGTMDVCASCTEQKDKTVAYLAETEAEFLTIQVNQMTPVFVERKVIYAHYTDWYSKTRGHGKKMRGDVQAENQFWKKLCPKGEEEKNFLPPPTRKKTFCGKERQCVAFSSSNKDLFRAAINHSNWTFGNDSDATEIATEIDNF
jgi:uncharacterized protein YaiE (UPF0345 family)